MASGSAVWETQCLNCGVALVGSFCAECGQRAVPPHPTVRELAGDAISELSGWDGKFIETFRLLLRKPGELTRQVLDGRRARFISPVRLYLTLSVLYFIVAAAAPRVRSNPATTEIGGISVGVFTPQVQKASGAGQVARAVADAQSGDLSKAQHDSALAQIAHAPALVRPIIRRAVDDPSGFRRSMLESMPRALFALVPVFAAILALFFRHRHYPEHLYLGLHLHAFIFLVLAVPQLLRFARMPRLVAGADVVVLSWIAVYAILSLRRVYGESIGKTLIKATGVGGLYVLTAGAAMIALVYWAAITA